MTGNTSNESQRAHLRLRRATIRDANFFYRVRMQAGETSPVFGVSLPEHRRWFCDRVLKSKWFVAVLGRGRRVRIGYVRIDEAEANALVISIAIDVRWRRRGYGSRILSMVSYPDERPVIATIHKDNTPSLEAFEKAGYVQTETSGVWRIYSRLTD